VNEVGVHDDYLRRGIGSRLTKALLDLVQADGDYDIWLATEHDNVAARALYNKLGARETGGIVVYDWGHAMDEEPA
ncbi:MAG: GNAT family N-acetyltransferase, partial [Paracoccaceae bacterium]